ncbi:hypothetical protein [Serratia rhizosphaerae]|uniref:Uncharacterized protein n=1 Tax=Serratia rhizosphaerae TaxID=2597702 RepID=A0ABX6GP42_9GAMM|nr:hypothetical protein [Serratia rhizosphaerae]QHA87994.1 hypothetical protein FO014_14050 [Serratia rhizosphaerae]
MNAGVIVLWIVWLVIMLFLLFFTLSYAVSEIISEVIKLITWKVREIEDEIFNGYLDVPEVEPTSEKESGMQ